MDLANLCICYPRCHPKCIRLGLADVTIAQPFVHIWEVFFGVDKLHIIMIFDSDLLRFMMEPSCHGGGHGMPSLRGGVYCVYDGYKGDYGESGS